MGIFGGNSGNAPSSEDKKSIFMKQIRQELAVAQAGELISKINENCFDKCIPEPGSTFDPNEKSCVSKCMERYMDAWNIVSRTYISRMQREQKNLN
ncbi:Mitochondrial import inner membrane translocase subunit tim13 [Schizosaccharomyces pombe]|uniref:Mitochondrial import inner membrane translocase subunit tim13 n=1 Tax=Schizosaccharomyces pombe (strain 972 / ATCC 24843) TaxID=284812 RepID=TIM13_SCHPO|nr:putative TIM22 inner membrane protein import complex subunit Tim13 [Schizosaccharomyces pombe]Q10481.1 RecName: Full=Mitochondrial import inner membrane translocase subunit tim13 [Schizosaccharomyces pombe 972h-]AAD40477.1 small zinc finger protein Tim13 [Schizosaccharomyces pombe]CAA97355.1 TIM22 inner membrane protein import complex subunit Tim13 (predicted) [Schizosaccharomyces pombe]|eukprot:NP_594597.1 putative TIM22 inner membrane protein import complex subunit Tim13 [Schizosaccharomyces pombe]